jgi:hypothetical protein
VSPILFSVQASLKILQRRAGRVAQWQSTCLAKVRPSVQSQYHQKTTQKLAQPCNSGTRRLRQRAGEFEASLDLQWESASKKPKTHPKEIFSCLWDISVSFLRHLICNMSPILNSLPVFQSCSLIPMKSAKQFFWVGGVFSDPPSCLILQVFFLRHLFVCLFVFWFQLLYWVF